MFSALSDLFLRLLQFNLTAVFICCRFFHFLCVYTFTFFDIPVIIACIPTSLVTLSGVTSSLFPLSFICIPPPFFTIHSFISVYLHGVVYESNDLPAPFFELMTPYSTPLVFILYLVSF